MERNIHGQAAGSVLLTAESCTANRIAASRSSKLISPTLREAGRRKTRA